MTIFDIHPLIADEFVRRGAPLLRRPARQQAALAFHYDAGIGSGRRDQRDPAAVMDDGRRWRRAFDPDIAAFAPSVRRKGVTSDR